jgi:hypothetical protein
MTHSKRRLLGRWGDWEQRQTNLRILVPLSVRTEFCEFSPGSEVSRVFEFSSQTMRELILGFGSNCLDVLNLKQMMNSTTSKKTLDLSRVI